MVLPLEVVTLAVVLVRVQMNCVQTGWSLCVEVAEVASGLGPGPGPGPVAVPGD